MPGKQRWAPRSHAAAAAHRRSGPGAQGLRATPHTGLQSKRSVQNAPVQSPAQPRTSTRPQLKASCFCSEKARPGDCWQASTEKGLRAPYHLPPCPSVQPTAGAGRVRPDPHSLPAGSELLLSAGGDRGGHGWSGIPTGEALGGTQVTRVGPGNREGVFWVQEGGKGLNGGPGSCSCQVLTPVLGTAAARGRWAAPAPGSAGPADHESSCQLPRVSIPTQFEPKNSQLIVCSETYCLALDCFLL